MKKIALIVPYFGKFGAGFAPWLKSAMANSSVDFHIYTNNIKPENLPSNIFWHNTTFTEVKNQINKKCGFKVNMKNAYRLCDFKPMYGDLFYEDIKNYDFWGFCYVDLVFGDIRKFVTEELLEKYSKIQELGHFVLIKNTPELITMYKQNIGKTYPYKVMFKSKYNTGFDEGGDGEYGYPNILKEHGYERFWQRDFADIKTDSFEFLHKAYKDGKPYFKKAEYVLYKDGKVYLKNQGEDILDERMYVHFQGRPMQNYLDGTENTFYVIPNAYVKDLQSYNYEEFVNGQKVAYNKKMKKTKSYRIKRKLYLLFYLARKGLLFDKKWRMYVMGAIR